MVTVRSIKPKGVCDGRFSGNRVEVGKLATTRVVGAEDVDKIGEGFPPLGKEGDMVGRATTIGTVKRGDINEIEVTKKEDVVSRVFIKRLPGFETRKKDSPVNGMLGVAVGYITGSNGKGPSVGFKSESNECSRGEGGEEMMRG
jgi:hypothetical protein